MDCRYCHSFVEVAAQSNVPNTQTCMNCHSQVQKDNPKLEPVRQSWKTGKPIEWVWLHRTVDYVFYNHAAHVNRGISCFSCHGPVNHMATVSIAEPHSMAWCLECHRHPENFLRPDDQIFNLDWKPDDVKPADQGGGQSASSRQRRRHRHIRASLRSRSLRSGALATLRESRQRFQSRRV